MSSLRFLYERIAPVQERALEERDPVSEARSRLSFDPRTCRRRQPVMRYLLVAAAAAVVFFVAWLGVQPSNISLKDHPDIAGQWISSSDTEDRRLEFTDGSQLTLRTGSSLRVQELEPEGARIQLEHGALNAEVKHRRNTRWKVDAGPYRVHVVGTRFEVSWNPQTEAFLLAMEEGTVKVEGPMLENARALRAGEEMRASVARQRVEIEERSGATTVIQKSEIRSEELSKDLRSEDEDLEEETLPSVSRSDRSIPLRGSTSAQKRASPAWQTLAEKGAFEDALTLARQQGLDRIAKSSPPGDLMMLGDAARRTGELVAAKKLYRAVHRRFPASPHGASAAFGLGIIAYDRERRFQEAAVWFESCVSSGLAGELNRPAMGRLLEARYRSGDVAGAKQTARDYLTRYPKGPHAEMADKILHVE